MLFGFAFLAYLQQKSITVAADRMMPELHLSQVQIGWIMEAFVVGYALFQLPGGVFGQRVGARRAFTITGLAAVFATVCTPLAPFWLKGTGLFVVLLSLQGLLGASQAAVFPVSAGVFETWFPQRRWSFVQGLQTMGISFGSALTPPLIVSLMALLGWQQALLWTAVPSLVLILIWAWYARNSPRQHNAVSEEELAVIGVADTPPIDSKISVRQLLLILRNRSVLMLAFSYLCFNYCFYLLSSWVFLYLVQERHFSVLESGWLASAPPLASAVGAGVGGAITSALCGKFGNRWGYRLLPMIAMPTVAVLLMFSVTTANPYWAVAGLATCFAVVELNEGAYWGGAMMVGGGDTMAVSGVMNTGGNLGGIIGIPIIAYLSGQHLWRLAFIIGAGFAVVSALAWLGVELRKKPGAVGEHASVNLAAAE